MEILCNIYNRLAGIRLLANDYVGAYSLYEECKKIAMGESVICIYINGQAIVEDYRIDSGLKEYTFKIPGGNIDRRAVLIIRSNTWTPGEYGIKGFPHKLGILIDHLSVNLID